jgi:hypothetical protein
MTEIEEAKLKDWRQSLFEVQFNTRQHGISQYAARRLTKVLHEINDLIGDGEDVDA